ncbi:MAG TPA: hypothetical protein VHZ95_23155 [Polyangiales bacterium]|nr:hypothetical protein [Polyangiales bacterium]
MCGEGRLADARSADDADEHGLFVADNRSPCVAQCGQLGVASDQAMHATRAIFDVAAKSMHHLRSVWSNTRVTRHELRRQPCEIREIVVPVWRHARLARGRCASGDRFEQHGTDAVPIGCERERCGCAGLGCAVAGCAERRAVVASVELRHQPEVEQHHATVARGEHVRRFDVAMELARIVKRLNTPRELRERCRDGDSIAGDVVAIRMERAAGCGG